MDISDNVTYLCLIAAVDGDPGEVPADNQGPERMPGGWVWIPVDQLSSAALHCFLPYEVKPTHPHCSVHYDKYHRDVHNQHLK